MYQDLKAHREVCKDDTLHMVTGRTVQFYTKKLVSFLQELDYNHLLQGIVQNSSGKVLMSKAETVYKKPIFIKKIFNQ